jgi:hypothetical protein
MHENTNTSNRWTINSHAHAECHKDIHQHRRQKSHLTSEIQTMESNLACMAGLKMIIIHDDFAVD